MAADDDVKKISARAAIDWLFSQSPYVIQAFLLNAVVIVGVFLICKYLVASQKEAWAAYTVETKSQREHDTLQTDKLIMRLDKQYDLLMGMRGHEHE